MLASYTAWLARTTREEVGVAIEEQRARDRPVIVATTIGVEDAPLDPAVGRRARVLTIELANVGLGPALDVRLHARYDRQATREKTLAVVPVAYRREVQLSLTGLDEPTEGLALQAD
jgi:hypothetical protein